MTIVLGIEKTHVTDGEDRFALQLVEEHHPSSDVGFHSLTIEDLTEDHVRRIGASRALSAAELDGYLEIARLGYTLRVRRSLRVS